MLEPKALAQAGGAIPPSSVFREGHILVQLKPGRKLTGLSSAKGYRVLRTFSESNLQVLQLPADVKVLDAVESLQSSGLVEFAEPDYLVQGAATPNDPAYGEGSLWGLNEKFQSPGMADPDIDAPEGWDVQNSASNVTIAVTDTGIRYTHEDLSANMWVNSGEIPGNGIDDDGNGYIDDVHGINAISGSGNPLDDHGHGTHVAGILGAIGNNGKGSVGVAWQARIMALKFLDHQNRGAVSDAIECVNYARSKGAQIINASWTISNYSVALQSAIVAARNSGIIFVAAAGNDGLNLDVNARYPGCYDSDNIVTVAATTEGRLFDLSYSNYGAKSVDLGAPGTWIYSTWFTSDSAYGYMSGTSMAAPYVSGVLALMRAHYPRENYKQLIGRLLESVDPMSTLTAKTVTGGLVNLRKALGVTGPDKLPEPKPSVVTLKVLSNPGAYQIQVKGEPGRKYVLQASSDFKVWSVISTNTAGTDGLISIKDIGARTVQQRFYRGISLP